LSLRPVVLGKAGPWQRTARPKGPFWK
jgi:hypothetical protein